MGLFVLKGFHLLTVVIVILNLLTFSIWRLVAPLGHSAERDQFMARQISLIHGRVTFPCLVSMGLTGPVLCLALGVPFRSPWIMEGLISWLILVAYWMAFIRPHTSLRVQTLGPSFVVKSVLMLMLTIGAALRMVDAAR